MTQRAFCRQYTVGISIAKQMKYCSCRVSVGNWERLVIPNVSEGLRSTQKVAYNEASYDAPRDDRLVYQDIRQGNYSDHLPFWAATLRSEKVCDAVRCSSELETTDVRYVAISIRE